MSLASVRKRLEAATRVPLNIVVVESGVTVPGILVAVMTADLDALEADLELMANVVEAAIELVADEESQPGGWGPDVTMLIPLVAALEAFKAAP